MEKQGKCSTSSQRRNRKRKPQEPSIPKYDSDSIFAILVAALSNLKKQPESLKPIVNKCLDELRLSLSLSLINPNPILSLLPTLLRSKYAGIASRGAEIVGAVSLLSLEMNQEIASDGETVKGLVSALASTKKRVSMAACNAVLDLGTTCFGREQLLHFCALEALM
ncbi:hypothetical protein TorRG33x02_335160 [Trema orientale]|uniref:Coatomer beta subunit n=1 Tax=Trema orientale TaxID=63057 RepID=A0A2P5B1R0_TREOI|nr:hypothetical protein TorRG33x02_335160 [Trema orientale]